MKTFKKRLLPLFLALTLSLSLLPVTALAAAEYTNIYQGDGYYISAKRYGNQELGLGFPYNSYFSDGLIDCGASGGYGYLDKDGNVVISGEMLDAIGCAKGGGDHFSEGLCFFRSTSGGYGYMDKTGRVVLQPDYRSNYENNEFHEGLALVENYKREGYKNSLRYIDQSGNTVLEVDDGSTGQSNFDGGKAVSCTTEIIDGRVYHRFNIIDLSGRILATYSPRKSDGSPSFLNSGCYYFSEGYCAVYNSSCELHVFDASGRLVWRLEDPLQGASWSYCATLDNPELSGVHGGILIYSAGRADGFDNKAVEIPSGRSVFPEGKVYTSIYDNFSDGVVTFKDENRGYGLVDSNGFEVVAPGEFDRINPFNEGLAIAIRKEEKVCYLLEKHEGIWSGALPQDPVQPEQPQQPAAPVQPQQPAGSLAYASTQSVDVDGRNISFQMYALKDANGNPTNYIKLRDVAFALNGTAAQFEVGWDGAVNIQPGLAYTPNGSEMSTPFSGDRAYEPAASETRINAVTANLEAIVLTDDQGGAYTYYKLRDLGKALGFNVGWSGERGIFVETDKPYQD